MHHRQLTPGFLLRSLVKAEHQKGAGGLVKGWDLYVPPLKALLVMQQVWEISTIWSCSPPTCSGKQHCILCRLQRQKKFPDSVGHAREALHSPLEAARTRWKWESQQGGTGKAKPCEAQAKQKKKSWKSSKLQFKVQSLPRVNEGGGQEMLLLHSDGTCEAMQPASLSLFPSSPQSFLHPRRCFSLTNPFLLQAGKNNSTILFTCVHQPLLDNQGMIFISAQFCPLHRETTGTQHKLPPFTSRPSRALINCSSYQPGHTSLAD